MWLPRVGPILLAGSLAACAPDSPPSLGERIADAQLEVIDARGSSWAVGDRLLLSDLEGRPTVLDFWASWCGPCRRQHEFVSALRRDYGDRINIVGILHDDSPDNAGPWLDEHGALYPTVIDPEGILADQLWMNGLPVFALLTPDRRLSWHFMGPAVEGNPYTTDSVTVRLNSILGSP